MKLSLLVSDEKHDEIARLLIEKGFEIDEDSELVLIEKNRYPSHLSVRDERGEKTYINVEDIILIETFGHNVEVASETGIYRAGVPLYQLDLSLDPASFLRISNSVIVNIRKIKRITPSLSMKFILDMKNGTKVDVTRSYYYAFKDYFNM